MTYSFKNEKGTWYLNRTGNILYFSKDKRPERLNSLPKGYRVLINPRTGMPIARKE